ncbi:MAG: hypothetical protein ACKO7D_01120 [Bacteroidota bacterium]
MIKSCSLLFLFFTTFLLFTSCGKYEEGPVISFVSKENRLCRTWVLEKIEHSNGYTTNEYYFKLTIEKDKNLQIEHKNNSDELVLTASSWEWFLGTYGLTLNLGYHPQGLPSGTVIFEIKRLTKKELWIQDRASLITYHFKSN